MTRPSRLTSRRHALGLLAAAALSAPGLAAAQEYPARPVRVLVPYPAGGTTDILARLVSEGLAQKFGQPFVVENRPGAGTALAAQQLVRAAPDGHTLLVSTGSTTAFMPLLNRNAGYTAEQIAPVAMIGRAPMVLDVPASSPFRTVRDLVEFAKANPGRLNAATQGAGATSHLTAELLRAAAGISFVPVHFQGSAPGLIATIAGQVDFYFDGVATSVPHVREGRLRGLAVTGERRTPGLPDVPTMREAGFPEVTVYSWYGFLAPTGTPAAAVERLNREVNAIIRSPAIVERLLREGGEPLAMSTPEFARFVDEEREMWRGVITRFDIRLE